VDERALCANFGHFSHSPEQLRLNFALAEGRDRASVVEEIVRVLRHRRSKPPAQKMKTHQANLSGWRPRIAAAFVLLLVAICSGACEPKSDNKEQRAFIARMAHAGDQIAAREALQMLDLTELCLIPESSSVELSLGRFGYRTPGGTQLKRRSEFSEAIIDGEVELLAITPSKQVLLYFNNADGTPFRLEFVALYSGCYNGQTATFKKSSGGWWQLGGERLSYKSH